jgi:hypothetical protein
VIDDPEFHDLVLQQPQRPARLPLGRFGTRQGDQLGFFLAVENAGHGRHLALFAAQNRLEPLFDELSADAVDHRGAGIQRHDDLAVAPARANRIRAFKSRRAGPLPLRISVSSCWRSSTLSLTTYFFTAMSFPAMITSLANSGQASESENPFKLVEAGD